ncbi:SufE family protein [Endothiovibrio diazotrophicus]
MTTLDELVEGFELLGDWEQRYRYLMELGEVLPRMPEHLKVEAHRVHGCMSRVWVCPYRDPREPQRIRFHGECDTAVIRGVLALLIRLTDGRRAEEIAALDVDEFFHRLQLNEHLSPSRHVGVYAIVELMKSLTRRLPAAAAHGGPEHHEAA